MLRAARLAFAAVAMLLAATGLHPARAAEPVSTPIADVVDSADVRREGDAIRHLASGFLFPAALGDMPARKLIVYAPGDISVQYTLRGGGEGDGWVDLYVYPAQEAAEAEAASLDALIAERYKGVAIPGPKEFAAADRDVASGWFDVEFGDRPYTTHYQIVRHGDWAVKLRLSLPRDAAPDVRERAVTALADHPARWR